MNFSEKLRIQRKEKGITQEQLAEALDVSRQAVSRWESDAGYPETEKLVLLAKLLDVSLDYLMLDKEAPAPKEKAVVKNTSGVISIMSADGHGVVFCISVKIAQILTGKNSNEPKYLLSGIDKVTFWGEHPTTLGYYESEEAAKNEIKEISEAIARGEASYTLKYNADIEYVGILGQPRIKPKDK